MKWEKVLLIPVSLPRNTRNEAATMNVHNVELDPESSSSDKRKLGATVKVENVELISESSKRKKVAASANVNAENVELVPDSNPSKGATMQVEKVELISGSSYSNTEHVGGEPRKMRHPETLTTLEVVRNRARTKGGRNAPIHVVYFDNTDLGYEWLMIGWIAEERFLPTARQGRGRTYKYYYDPYGNMYYTKEEVLYAWKKNNMKVKTP